MDDVPPSLVGQDQVFSDDDSYSESSSSSAVCSGDFQIEDEPVQAAPATILCGWLGSGKSTLVRQLLDYCASIGEKILLVQNEVAETEGTEDLTFKEADYSIVELPNGCVCCSVKSNFVSSVEAAVRINKFDRIVVECSGVAHPAPLIESLWLDKQLESALYLDCIVCVVDASRLLDPSSSAPHGERSGIHKFMTRQMAFANTILINKKDLVGLEDWKRVKQVVTKFAPDNCKCVECEHCRVNLGTYILDQHCYEQRSLSEREIRFRDEGVPIEDKMDLHLSLVSHMHVLTFELSVQESGMCNLELFQLWIGKLVWGKLGVPSEKVTASGQILSDGDDDVPLEPDFEIYRYKGIVHAHPTGQVHFLQGVGKLFDVYPLAGKKQDQVRHGKNAKHKLVFIGRHLKPYEQLWRSQFMRTMVDRESIPSVASSR